MSSCPRWPWEREGPVGASNQYQQMRTNLRTSYKLKTGRRTATRQSQKGRCLLFLYLVLRAIGPRPSASHFTEVCAGRITGPQSTGKWLECAQKLPPIVNAFLTLSAVTK